MNYTKWMLQNFPSTQSWSSADTYKLIEQAKGKAKILEFALTLIFTVSAVYLSFYFGTLFSAVPYEGVLGWLNIIFCLVLAFEIQKSIIKVVVKRELKHQILKT